MSAFKPYPILVMEDGQVDGLYRLQTERGRAIIAGHFRTKADAERLADCWNALRQIAFPLAHVPATDEYVARLEQLRKDAIAMASSGPGTTWSFDMSTAPRDRQILVRTTKSDRAFLTSWLEPTKFTPNGRFDGFPENAKTLLAWCDLRAFPSAADAQGEAVVPSADRVSLDEGSSVSANAGGEDVTGAGNTHPHTAEGLDSCSSAHLPIIDDCGSGA